MKIDEVDYETDDLDDSIFCTKEEVHCTKAQMEKKVDEMHSTTTHMKTSLSNEARSNSMHTGKTMIDHDCANVRNKKNKKNQRS